MTGFVAGILRCDVCQSEHKALGAKAGPLYLAKGLECDRCHGETCVWDDVRHFDDEAEADAYARSMILTPEPQPPKDVA